MSIKEAEKVEAVEAEEVKVEATPEKKGFFDNVGEVVGNVVGSTPFKVGAGILLGAGAAYLVLNQHEVETDVFEEVIDVIGDEVGE